MRIKKFTLLTLALIMMSVVANAQKTTMLQQALNKAEMRLAEFGVFKFETPIPVENGVQTPRTIDNNVQMVGSQRSAADYPVITEQPAGELKSYARSGGYYFVSGSQLYYADQTGDINVVWGTDGKVYFKNLVSGSPYGSWVYGTLSSDGTTITVPLGQNIYYSSNYDAAIAIRLINYTGSNFVVDETATSVTLTVSGSTLTLQGTSFAGVSLGAVWTDDGTVDSYGDYGSVYTELQDVAATPATPTIVGLTESSSYGWYVDFDVPTVDVNGTPLLSDKLSYILYSDVEGTVTPLTFTPATHQYLTENMTEIPYGFTEGWDFYTSRIYLNDVYSDTWNKIGIKSIYRGGGEEHASEISWLTVKFPPAQYNFDDSSMQGWTAIDADGDGYNWILGSQVGGVYLKEGSTLAGSGHNASADMVCSGSYANPTYAALTPDNYLVSPKVKLGGKITFFASAQDASYPSEHFGVAVSTAGNTSASDFTTIWESTMTSAPAMAPQANAPKNSFRSSHRAQGSWHYYEVDLSAYAGQEGYVAIRHFNCSDWFLLNVDDITIEEPAVQFVDVTINNLEPGSITDAITAAAGTDKIRDLNIKLKNGDYTIEAPIVASGNVVIDGANGTIDASALADPFLSLNAEPVIEPNTAGAFPIDNITFKNVTITNLKSNLVKSNNLYLVQKLLVDNCIIGIKGASKKTIFDFSTQTGGNVIELAVTKSTLWADDATQWQNGGFFSSQSSKKLNQLGVENPQQITSIKNSTFYNIAKGKTTSTLIQNSQSWQVYEVYDNIIVNSGKSGQFCAGLNGGQKGKVENWYVDGNTFMFDGADVSATESEKINGGISESIIGDPGFADPANGDFTVGEQAEQQLTRTGDPRWLGQYLPDHVTAPIELTPLDGSNLTEVLAEAYAESLAPAYITINLLPGGHYTVSDPMEINATFSIIGDEANPATVDLGDCSGAMVQFSANLAPAFTVNDYGFWEQPFNVLFKNVIFSNVKNQLFYANKQPYLVEFFDFQNCIAEYRGGSKTVFDFNGGGVVENLTINNSTIYGNSYDGKHTGALYSSQSGKKITDAVPDGKQYFNITNSTLFNIANGRKTMEHRSTGQKFLVFTVKNNVIIDCGKNHQFSQGLNGGQASNNPTYFVHYNSFMRTTADRTLIDDVEETTGDTEEVVTASWLNTYPETPIVDIFPKWFEQDEIGQYNTYFRGNFTVAEGSVQKTNSVGDPRWLRNDNEYTDIQGIAAEKAAEGEWYTVQGVRVDQPTKGLYIHNGRKVVIK